MSFNVQRTGGAPRWEFWGYQGRRPNGEEHGHDCLWVPGLGLQLWGLLFRVPGLELRGMFFILFFSVLIL